MSGRARNGPAAKAARAIGHCRSSRRGLGCTRMARMARAMRGNAGVVRPTYAEIGHVWRIHEGHVPGFGRSPGPRGAVVVTGRSRSRARASADGCVGERLRERRHCWRRLCATFSPKPPAVIGAVVSLPASAVPTVDARKRDTGGGREIATRTFP